MKNKLLISILSLLLFISCTDGYEEILDNSLTRSDSNSGVIYGVIFDNDTQMPLPGATVSLYPSGKRVITGSDGQYEFQNLSANNYIIQVQHADYLSTADALNLKDGASVKRDTRMMRGSNTIIVEEHEIHCSDVDSQHSLLISNTSNKPVRWIISYDDRFDPATGASQIFISEWEGELQPYETKELFIRFVVSATLNNNYAIPLILQSGNEKIGFVIIPSDGDGKINSKIIGKWDLYRTGHYDEGLPVSQYVSSGAYVLTLKDDMTYELFNNYAEIWLDTADENVKLEDVWNLSFSSGSFTYNPTERILFLGDSFTVGYYWIVLNVTDTELILGSIDYDEVTKEGAIYFYKKI